MELSVPLSITRRDFLRNASTAALACAALPVPAAAGPQLTVQGEVLGTPALAHGCLFIQTVNGLYCISGKR